MDLTESPRFRCVIHGSFRRHWREIQDARRIFVNAGIEVLAPSAAGVIGERDGFVWLDGEDGCDPRAIELAYLQNLKRLGENGFSYFVAPDGWLGRSASYELGIAQTTNVRCFFSHQPKDHPVYVPGSSLWPADRLADFLVTRGELPAPQIRPDEARIHQLWERLLVPGSVVAVGGMIEYAPDDPSKEKEILLVRTHKWNGRYSLIGGRVRRHERLHDALCREIQEETGLTGTVADHLCTFDQIKNSGYYVSGVQHLFVDYVFRTANKRVTLNDEAEEFVWMPAVAALRDLPIEPNARHTLELYHRAASV